MVRVHPAVPVLSSTKVAPALSLHACWQRAAIRSGNNSRPLYLNATGRRGGEATLAILAYQAPMRLHPSLKCP